MIRVTIEVDHAEHEFTIRRETAYSPTVTASETVQQLAKEAVAAMQAALNSKP